MSAYAGILIQNLYLYSFRNCLDIYIVELLFSKCDLKIEENFIDEDDETAEPYTRYSYQTTVKRAKERLDAMGYSVISSEKYLVANVFEVLDYAPFLYHLGVSFDELEEESKDRIEKYFTFKKWKNALDRIIKHELKHGNITSFSKDHDFCPKTEYDKLIYYALKDEDAESYYAIDIEVMDLAYIFRQILECCNNDDSIILDFTSLVSWDEDNIPSAIDCTEKCIVLVEGSSDKNILEFALGMIYPHLADLFYFMDFSDQNGNTRPGGTPEIKKQMEVFYYSKLQAKFIAVFDNDAIGFKDKTLLLYEKIKNWPENFRILCYPQNSFFNKYPTLAPSGQLLFDNINRKACSIELYLPDRLIKQDGGYSPIEWESRQKIKYADEGTEYLYQGVISNKEKIKKDFHKLKNDIESGKESFDISEWKRMKELLDAIVFAFKYDQNT